MPQRIGLFGGTFDPIHFGHLRAAEEVYEALNLEKVIFIPAGIPPHKHRPDLSPFEDRLKMVSLAIQGIGHFKVDDLEGKRKEPSYTVITLKRLRQTHPQQEFFFILGLDAFCEIDTWYEYNQLPLLAHLVVITRGEGGWERFRQKVHQAFRDFYEDKEKFIFPKGYSLSYLETTRMDISASLIREKIKKNLSIRFLTPEPVRHYIMTNKLYR